MITEKLQELYDLLSDSNELVAEEVLGLIAEAKALWEGDTGSFAE